MLIERNTTLTLSMSDKGLLEKSNLSDVNIDNKYQNGEEKDNFEYEYENEVKEIQDPTNTETVGVATKLNPVESKKPIVIENQATSRATSSDLKVIPLPPISSEVKESQELTNAEVVGVTSKLKSHERKKPIDNENKATRSSLKFNPLPSISPEGGSHEKEAKIDNSHGIIKKDPNNVTKSLKHKKSMLTISKPIAKNEQNDPVIQSLYRGACKFSSLPPLTKKAVRIFISSTFSDTKEERNALMKHVYPKLADYCRQKYGLEFQVVDMRWGVPEQAAENHSTTDLCLQEIRKCHEVSVGPCFVVLVGNKYGFRPIPNEIEEKLFLNLLEGTEPNESKGLIEEWYLRDDNSLSVVYVLQPISKIFPHIHSTDKSKQKESWNEWEKSNMNLRTALRDAAKGAHEKNLITEEDMHKFYMSVTESEISEGINTKSGEQTRNTCTCIIREIPDISDHKEKDIAQKFIDLKSDNSMDEEAQNLLKHLKKDKIPRKLPKSNIKQVSIEWSFSGASISLETTQETDMGQEHVERHKKYLDEICENFYNAMKDQVDAGSVINSNLYTEMTEEILHHMHIAKTRCEVFEGRDDIIHKAKEYINSDANVPLTVYGKSGCGKTSVLAKILELLINVDTTENQPLVFARFLGTTPQTSNLYLLIVSMCTQISQLTKRTWVEPAKFSDLVKSFHLLLEETAQSQTLILILDSIDQLLPAYNAYKVTWLPEALPPNIKIIVSTIEEGYPIVKSLRDRYESKGAQFLEVTQLGDQLGMIVILKWLSLKKRKLSLKQMEVVKKALSWCSLPLYVRITYDQIRKWHSYDEISTANLQETVKGAINQMFTSMELKFGQALVQHSLGYLTASRHGLSEVELEHLLSLDDVLLNKIYKYWRPPVRRIPPLLWTRIRAELSSYIVERSADDIIVLSWYHRQFTEATRGRYLNDKEFTMSIHRSMADFFLGKWGGGKLKPFQYTDHQKKRFKLESNDGEADRKVPLQPYIIEMENDNGTELKFNKRKIFELPFHLAKIKDYSLLKSEIFFNFEWIFATLKSSSAMSVLDEFKIFMAGEKQLRRDMDMRLLFANMRMVRPYITKYPDTLGYELSGRLAKYISSSQLMRSLVKQCDEIGSKYCPLTPVVTCFPTATVGLQQNINYRASESWHRGGAFTCSKDFKTMYIIDHDDFGICQMSCWDIESGEMISSLPISWQGAQVKRIIYVQVMADKTDEYLIGLNRGKDLLSLNRGKKYQVEGEDFGYGDGNVDIIRIEDGLVVQSYSESFQAGGFANPVLYTTDNWVAVRMGNKLPLFNIYTNHSKRLNKPHILSKDESLFAITNKDGTVLRKFEGKITLGEFDVPEAVLALAISEDNNVVVFAGPDLGELWVYNLSNKMLNTEKLYVSTLRTKKIVTSVPQYIKDALEDVVTRKADGRVCATAHIIISSDLEYALVLYMGPTMWIPLLYHIFRGKKIANLIGIVGHPVARYTRYPSFSYDNQHIVVAKNCVNGKKVVQVYSSVSGAKVQEFFVMQAIKDYCVSNVSDQIAVMTGKDVAFFSIGNPQEDTKESKKRVKARKKPTKEVHDQVLIQREVFDNKHIGNELVLIQSGVDAVVEEVEGAAHVIDTDTIASARSKKSLALDMHFSPDGIKVVQLHSRTQVVDKRTEDIVYTPASEDVISRTTVNDGQPHSFSINIQDGLNKIVDLQTSDRIVNANNKVKFRVTSANRHQIAYVPSVISVYTGLGGKVKRLQRFMVYQESIHTVSNKYIVTSKQREGEDYVNIYNMETGTLIATHKVEGGFGAAALPTNESLLIVVSKYLVVRAYQAPLFNSCEIKIETREIVENRRATITEIMCCKSPNVLDEGGNRIVIHYKPIHSVAGKFCYQLVNLVNKEVGKHIVSKTAFEDISRSGEYAIDSQLNVFSLQQGIQIGQVPYGDSETTERLNVRVKFSEDMKYIILVNKMDDSLHVFQWEGEDFIHIAACFSHAPKMEMFNGLSVRQHGRMIMIRSKGAALILLKIRELDGRITGQNINYESEMDRAMSILSNY